MQEPLKVAITDDNQNFRESLRDILAFESDIEVVALWSHGLEALAGLGTVKPDVVLLDINMPMMSGVEATRQILAKYPAVKIIVLSMHDDSMYVLETLKAGASGYLVKDGYSGEVIRAIREVAAGNAMVHPRVTPALIAQFQAKAAELSDSWKGVLTRREMDVLRELTQGKSSKDIAACLHISQKTVKNYVFHITSKLGVSDRTQAVMVALKRRWVQS